jgi:hypothetical protein
MGPSPPRAPEEAAARLAFSDILASSLLLRRSRNVQPFDFGHAIVIAIVALDSNERTPFSSDLELHP